MIQFALYVIDFVGVGEAVVKASEWHNWTTGWLVGFPFTSQPQRSTGHNFISTIVDWNISQVNYFISPRSDNSSFDNIILTTLCSSWQAVEKVEYS